MVRQIYSLPPLATWVTYQWGQLRAILGEVKKVASMQTKPLKTLVETGVVKHMKRKNKYSLRAKIAGVERSAKASRKRILYSSCNPSTSATVTKTTNREEQSERE